MSFLRLGVGLLDSPWRHRNGSEDINITIFGNMKSKKLKSILQLISTFLIFSFPELIDLKRPMIFCQVLQI